MQISAGTSKGGLAARPLTKTDRFPAAALFGGSKWNNDVAAAWVILGQSLLFLWALPPSFCCSPGRQGCCSLLPLCLCVLGRWGDHFYNSFTNTSRANGQRQSNLLLQGISWLPAGLGRDFALPPLRGSAVAQFEPHPKKPCDPHNVSFFSFFLSVLLSCEKLQKG